MLARVSRPLGGLKGGSGEYVYQLPHVKTRVPNLHTLDIGELYVRLRESVVSQDLPGIPVFDPEPWSYVKVGQLELKPDFYVDLGRFRWWGELDRGTEYRTQLAHKMRRYVQAYNQWPEETFPQVLWVCHDGERKRYIESVIRHTAIPQLFTVALFDDAVDRLLT